MACQIEDMGVFKKRLVFNIHHQELEEFDLTSRQEVFFKKKQKEVNLKGFRKGKAPLSLIKKMYPYKFSADFFSDIIIENVYVTAKKENIDVIYIYPVTDLHHDKESDALRFSIILDFIPKIIPIKDISGYVLTKREANKVTDEEFNRELKRVYLAPKAELRECEGEDVFFQKESYGTVALQIVPEDGSRPEFPKEECTLAPEQNEFIPGLKENVLGMMKGEKTSFEITLPENFPDENLQNVTATLEVELLEIKEPILPELNDEFAREHNFENADDLRNSLRKELTKQKEEEVRDQLIHDLDNKIFEDNDFEIPDSLLEEREIEYKEEVRERFKKLGFTSNMIHDIFEKNQSNLKKESFDRTKRELIFKGLTQKYQMPIPKEAPSYTEEEAIKLMYKLFDKVLQDVTIVEETDTTKI